MCTMRGQKNQFRTRMRNALAPRNLPGAEGLGNSSIVLARGTYMKPFSRANSPQWMR